MNLRDYSQTGSCGNCGYDKTDTLGKNRYCGICGTEKD